MLTEPWVLGTWQRAEQTRPWGGWSKSNSWVPPPPPPKCLHRRSRFTGEENGASQKVGLAKMQVPRPSPGAS